MHEHENYMRRCVELALLGSGKVSPNPLVGAVIVHEGRIIGEGFHQQYGKAHAEVNAITQVLDKHENGAELLKQSTIYVSLEPCSHFGKTPPCADLIIRHEIPQVVVGCRDPFDQVNGKGIEKLRQQGVAVVESVLEEECIAANKRFFTRVRKQRPYIILKWAETGDGYFAPENNTKRWITSKQSQILVHKWRSEEDAVLIGKKTALADNPQLTVREFKGRNPKRVVLDKNLELPAHLNLFDQSVETLVFNQQKTGTEGNVRYFEVEDFDFYLPHLIAYQLYLLDVQSLIIEGGAKTLQAFIKAGIWDEARIFRARECWGKGIKAPQIHECNREELQVGTDTLQIKYNSGERLF